MARFLVPSKRERYAEFLFRPKGRQKFIGELAHFKSLDPKCIVLIPPSEHKPTTVARILESRGAPTMSRVVSEDSDLDAREMELVRALKETIGRGMGTFISCIPGKLAFFEDEDGRYILLRSKWLTGFLLLSN